MILDTFNKLTEIYRDKTKKANEQKNFLLHSKHRPHIKKIAYSDKINVLIYFTKAQKIELSYEINNESLYHIKRNEKTKLPDNLLEAIEYIKQNLK